MRNSPRKLIPHLASLALVSALAATPALAIDLGGQAGIGVQAGPVNVNAATGAAARAAGPDVRDVARGARDTGVRAGTQVTGRAAAAADAAHDTGARTARRTGQAVGQSAAAVEGTVHGAQAHGTHTRAGARVDAQGAVNANERARAAVGANVDAEANSQITQPQNGDH